MIPLDSTPPPKRKILFLEQQSWLSGAQRVLEIVLNAIAPEFEPLVAFPNSGPFAKKLADRNIETLFTPLGTYQSGQKYYSEMLAFSLRSLVCGVQLATVIRKRNVSLLYINGPRCLPAGVLASRLTGCPAVFHQHLTLTRHREVSLVNFLARYVSAIVTCSEASARPMLKADAGLGSRIHILYSPLSDVTRTGRSLKKPSIASSGITLGMVGRISEHKGNRELLRAIGMLRPELRARLQVVFVGAPAPGDLRDRAYAQEIQDLARQLGLSRQTHWAGYQLDPMPFYALMDVLVQPSSAQSGEAMPLAILEALRQGVPVIASDTGGISEVIQSGANGLLVPPEETGALAQALEQFLEDATLRARLQSGARATPLERFSADGFRSKLHGLIGELTGCDLPRRVSAARRERTS